MTRYWIKHTDETPKVDITFDHNLDITDQDHEAESNINTIMTRYLAGEPLPPNVKVGTYGDFYEAPDFTRAQEILAQATQQFEALPSSIRNRFDNRPERFLAFVHDKNNLTEARNLGLLTQQTPPPAQPASTTTDTLPKKETP